MLLFAATPGTGRELHAAGAAGRPGRRRRRRLRDPPRPRPTPTTRRPTSRSPASSAPSPSTGRRSRAASATSSRAAAPPSPSPYTIKFENLPPATRQRRVRHHHRRDRPQPEPGLTPDREHVVRLDVLLHASRAGRSRSASRASTCRRTGPRPRARASSRFTSRPNAGLPDGTEIRNDADIVFDFNPPIAHPEVLHEIRRRSDVAGPSRRRTSSSSGPARRRGRRGQPARRPVSEQTAVTIRRPAACPA